MYTVGTTDFNPRSREGSDGYAHRQRLPIIISIHAPARGATVLILRMELYQVLFQSTLPRGERLTNGVESKTYKLISIHAPARGATIRMDKFCIGTGNFNPRSREGSDRIYLKRLRQFVRFQSTLPRGERRFDCSNKSGRQYFNPRSREGSDRRYEWGVKPFGNFNPRSREGSDDEILYRTRRRRHFNPRSREGSDDLRYRILIPAKYISIHAPARGATVTVGSISNYENISIHAPARGATGRQLEIHCQS